jgi:hypothetical protein
MVVAMSKPSDNATPGRQPPRSGLRRLIAPVVYRHLRGFGVGHIAGGSLQAAAGLVCLAYDADGWAAFFLTISALNLAGGYWYLTIDATTTPVT